MKPDLVRASEVIDEYAELLADSHMVDGKWPTTLDEFAFHARQSCLEFRALADRLRKAMC